MPIQLSGLDFALAYMPADPLATEDQLYVQQLQSKSPDRYDAYLQEEHRKEAGTLTVQDDGSLLFQGASGLPVTTLAGVVGQMIFPGQVAPSVVIAGTRTVETEHTFWRDPATGRLSELNRVHKKGTFASAAVIGK